MLELAPDEGWDAEITASSSKGYKALKSNFIDNGLVAYYKGNTYVYLSSLNRWSVLISAEAQRQLCDITGGENASVSYLAASLPYIGYIEKHATRAGRIPVSICIGTRRLAISREEISKGKYRMELNDCDSVVSVNENLDSRVEGFCTMPSSFTQIPRSWSSGGDDRVLRFIRVLFIDQTELMTIMWILGLAAVDPSIVSKFLLLYGPGGTGKSTVIGLIEDTFNGCCGTINSNVLTARNSTINVDSARTVASNRIVTAGDLNLETNQLNLHTVKEITGQDSISVPPIKVRTRCTLVAASNDLPHPTTQKTWSSAAISRRTIVVPMNVKTALIPTAERPDSEDDLLNFQLQCVNVYLDNLRSPPCSIRTLFYTVLGSGFHEIREKIQYSDSDGEFEDQEVFDANTAIDIHFGFDLHSTAENAFLVCPDLVTVIGSIYFIKNIRLLEELSND